MKLYILHLGMYTVMVAAMQRHAVAVDPMIYNLGLIHTSLKKANHEKYVTLVQAALRLT